MTAYGRSVLNTSLGRFTVEIQSVNKRFLEVNVHLPREFMRFEKEVRKWIVAKVKRGQINVYISIHLLEGASLFVKPNLAFAKQFKLAWDQIYSALNLSSKDYFDFNLMANEKGLFSFEEDTTRDELYFKDLCKAVDDALVFFSGMKEEEGKALYIEIKRRLGILRSKVSYIEKKAPFATHRYREKLCSHLEEILSGCLENDERILREVALFSERIDITEEITRFHLHLDKFDDLLSAPMMDSGKILEFLLQEMHREVNTIGSKSSDIEVAHYVVEMKAELEKIREQIQNVE